MPFSSSERGFSVTGDPSVAYRTPSVKEKNRGGKIALQFKCFHLFTE
jgi:hypothetical protein